MNKLSKLFTLIIVALVVANFAMAQSISDGIKMLNYQKNQSSKDIFKKLYEADNKNPEVIYWYGQAFLAFDDYAGAKAVYQKALQDGVNNPYIIVGMGHVEIMEGGDINSAKQKFEQAITMAKEFKGKKKTQVYPEILDAIGRANADGGSKKGDPTYAIDKLKEAATLDDKSADILIDMGICYLKMGADEGGDAVKSYMDAATREPKNPLPSYKIGRIYQSQNNKELFDQFYNTTISIDPTFPPVYLSLYDYYAFRDVAKAKEYLEKYIQYADKSCETEYFYGDYLFREGKYQESLEKVKALEAGDCKGYYRNNLLFAYDYDRLGDSINAKVFIDKYFSNVAVNKITNSDYEIAISIYSKISGSDSEAVGYIQKAIEADTVLADKVKYANQAADIYGKAKKYKEQIKWLQKAVSLKGGTMGEADYYKLASTALSGKDYGATLEIAKNYITGFPDKPQGYYFSVKAAKGIDTSNTLGTAINPMTQQNDFLTKQNEVLAKDSVTNKKTIERNTNIVYSNLCYMMGYYNDVQKDVPKAIDACDKIIVLYPDVTSEQNKFAVHIKDVLQKSLSKPSGNKSGTNSKPQK